MRTLTATPPSPLVVISADVLNSQLMFNKCYNMLNAINVITYVSNNVCLFPWSGIDQLHVFLSDTFLIFKYLHSLLCSLFVHLL